MQGHNSGELDRLAKIAREGLDKVSEGEEYTIEGWLRYGSALNAGREMFPSDEQFGQWVRDSQLARDGITFDERAAAMWAAKDLDRFNEVREAYPRVRTVRGLHAKWKEEEAKRKAEEGDDDKPNEDDNDDVVDNNKSGGNKPNSKPKGNTPKPSSGQGGPKKPKPIHNPDYSILEGMGTIKGVAELYAREYVGTPEEAADVLFSQTIKGCEQDSTSMSIARDRVKWFLELKEVMDLAEPRMHEFLNQESKLKVVK